MGGSAVKRASVRFTAPSWLTRFKVPRKSRGPIAVILLALGTCTLAWAIHSGRLTDFSGFDRAAAQASIGRSSEFLRSVRTAKEKLADLDARIAATSNASLGDRLDVVDSALRARLNRIAEETGLRDLIVATAQAIERRNPARQEMTRLSLPRAMRDEPDFVEVRATISGEGAVDQVLRLLHRIAIDPMVKRIETVKFDPVKDGSRVRVTLKLATIFLPGVPPDSMPGAPSAEMLAGFSKYAVLAQRNPFRLPEPPAPPATAVAAAPPAAAPATPDAPVAAPTAEAVPGFPYAQWILTGVIDGPAGTEAWFRNTTNNEARVLRLSESIAEFALVGLAPEGARISAGGATYVLRVGDSLEARAVETAAK